MFSIKCQFCTMTMKIENIWDHLQGWVPPSIDQVLPRHSICWPKHPPTQLWPVTSKGKNLKGRKTLKIPPEAKKEWKMWDRQFCPRPVAFLPEHNVGGHGIYAAWFEVRSSHFALSIHGQPDWKGCKPSWPQIPHHQYGGNALGTPTSPSHVPHLCDRKGWKGRKWQ